MADNSHTSPGSSTSGESNLAAKTSSSRTQTTALRAALIVSALYLLARFTGLIQYAVLNALLDRDQTDAYWAAFAVPDFINYLVAGGALSITFIPIFSKLQQTGREREAWQFFSSIATLMAGVLLVLLIVSFFCVEQLVSVARSGLHGRPAVFDLAVDMTRILLPAQWFFYLGGLLVGVLNVQKRFGAGSSTGFVYNVVAIVIALLLYWLGVGPIAFAWGILIGAFCGNFLLPLVATVRSPEEQRPKYSPRLDLRSPEVRRYFLNALPIMLGVSLPVVDQIVVGWFASFLQEGVLSYLGSSNRVMIAAQGIVGQAASVAAFPFLSELAARNEWPQYSKFMRDGLRRLLFVTLPLSTLMILLARPIVVLVYGYGNFDEPVALQETSAALAFYCVGLFAWVGQQLVARGFYAMQDTLTPTIIGTVLTIFFFIPLTWAVAHGYLFGGGAAGLALATSVGACAHFLGVLLALEKRLSSRKYSAPLRLEKIGGLLFRTLAACFVMGLAGALISSLFDNFFSDGKLGAIAQIVVAGGAATVAFALCARLFNIPEWNWIAAKVLSRRKKASS